MTDKAPSIETAPELVAWLETPPGRYLLAWEQAQVDAAVADLFGFHALQLGLPSLQALQANRMPHRWVAGVDLQCDFDALPFESGSMDLVVLPHALEQAADAHRLLREVERVLRPEGRLIVFGLNPASLWGMRQKLGRLRPGQPCYLPRSGEFLGYWRLRDWLKLLSFEVERARFGLYRPPLRSEAWLERWQWVEPIGSRWWPVLGAVYFIQAIKRVHGTRMIGLARNKRLAAKKAPAVALNNQNKE
ncbi:MAG: SAM-dependent methyltransferase [Roseateles depolymerans]|uniref:SAM-dependent methyltransferase n=1 Tax=Roseateles depolymerans TaxID=76731 RepID=A0A2W5DX71_9BURK|nr:MAG: SAM-dependent methyltransferase [Roseateles depolymerans]